MLERTHSPMAGTGWICPGGGGVPAARTSAGKGACHRRPWNSRCSSLLYDMTPADENALTGGKAEFGIHQKIDAAMIFAGHHNGSRRSVVVRLDAWEGGLPSARYLV